MASAKFNYLMDFLWLLSALVILLTIESSLAQHAKCIADPDGSGTVCSGGGFMLPINFDVAQLDPNQKSLTIGSLAVGTLPNEATNQSIPFPASKNLLEVYFYDFNFNVLERFEFNRLLQNNKQIRTISLYKVNLDKLNSDDFRGFMDLEKFTCTGVKLFQMDVKTFNELGQLPSGVIAPGYKPKLSLLSITDSVMGNYAVVWDWSFLKPVSESLTTIVLKGIRLYELRATEPFLLEKATHINLERNELKEIPPAVFNTFNMDLPLEIQLYENYFCSSDYTSYDCSCCAMADLFSWLRRNDKLDSVESLSCGSLYGTPKERFGLRRPALSDPYLHSHCQLSKPSVPIRPPTAPEVPDEDISPTAPLKVSCVKGVIKRPVVDFELLEATQIDFDSDQSRKCLLTAYSLHEWLVEKSVASGIKTHIAGVMGKSNQGVSASCFGRGEVVISEDDLDSVESTSITVKVAITPKCRQFFVDYLNVILDLKK